MFNFEDPVLKTGANGGEVPPVPIPNTEVKLTSVENTWLETAWEDRAAPVQTVRKLVLYGLFDVYSSGSFGGRYSSLAQSVERSAVNRNVVGSSPTGGASLRKETQTEHRASGVPIVGVDGGGGTPVPIPNTAVKPTCVEDTWLEAARENRQMPTSQAPEVI